MESAVERRKRENFVLGVGYRRGVQDATNEGQLEIGLLGELSIRRGGAALALPPSRKTRALLAYLVLTKRAHRRDRLCSMFWDVTDDPRGALRWSLSKIRNLVDDGEQRRIEATREHVTFAAARCHVDVLSLRRDLERADLSTTPLETLEAWANQFRGELLEGLDLSEFDDYQAWCVAEREQARKMRAKILAMLTDRCRSQPERALPHARARVRVDPLNHAARVELLRLAVAAGRREEAEQHYESGRRWLEEVGSAQVQDLVEAWRELKSGHSSVSVGSVAADAMGAGSNALDEDAPVSRVMSDDRDSGDLVGRRREQALLATALDDVVRTRREHIVVLTGEPGIGKSTLVTELCTQARARGATVVAGAAFEGETGRPYGPWIDGLRSLKEQHPALGNGLSLLVPDLGRDETTELTRDRLFAGVSELVSTTAHSSPPVLIVLDDVQWLDPASAELTHYVARTSKQLPVLLVLVARSEELADNAVLSKALRGLRRERLTRDLRLEPLEADAVGELVRRVGASIPAETVYRQSGGNPLFALELVRGLIPGSETLPRSVADAVRDRVERLAPGAYDVLRWAAVLGSQFVVERLESVTVMGSDEVLDALESLERYALVRGVGSPGEYRFAHEVVRRVVYADISEPRRQLMHRRVARCLQEEPDSEGSLVAELAQHATLGHDDDLAATACTHAGRRCVKMFANQQAQSLVRRGMRHAERLPRASRVQRMIELLEVQLGAASTGVNHAAARQIEALSEEALDLGLLHHARLAFLLLGYINWEDGDWDVARRRMLQMEVTSRSEDPQRRVVALASAGRCLVLLERDLPQAHAMLLEAEARARQLDIEPAELLDGLGMIRAHLGHPSEAAPLFDRARQVASAARDRLHEYAAIEHTAMMQLEHRDYASASRSAVTLQELSSKMREGSEGPFAQAVVGLTERALGRQGEEQLEAGLEALRNADAKYRLAYALTHAAWLDVEAGDPRRARDRAAEALPIARLLERPSETLFALVLLARACRDLGDAPAHDTYTEQIQRGSWQCASATVRARHEDLLGTPLRRVEPQIADEGGESWPPAPAGDTTSLRAEV